MYTAVVEKDHIQVNSSFQVVQRFAETQTKARKTAQVCPNAEIGSLDVASRDVFGIGVSGDWDRDCGFDLGRAVPVRGFTVRSSVEFEKLREVNASTKVFFDGRNISAQTIRCDLESSGNTFAQIADKVISTRRVPLGSQIGQAEFGFAINRHPNVGVAPLSRIVRRKVGRFGVNEGPQLVSLHKARSNFAHSTIKVSCLS